MSVTQSYSRPKAATVNNTGIVMTAFVTEKPVTNPTSNGILTSGSTGVINISWYADANESGSTDIQEIMRAIITPSLSAGGTLTYNVAIYAVDGDGTVHLLTSLSFDHTQDMDTWQTAAGRARQS